MATKRSLCIETERIILKRPRRSCGEKSCDSCDEEESIYSLQNRDTDVARDTSDTSLDSDDGIAVEYEVTNVSPDRNNPFFSTDDSDEINEINEIAELGAVVAAVTDFNDIDLGQLADTSTEMSTSPTSNSDPDPELPRLDYLDFWTCAQCKAVNENRHVPFCSECYRTRKNFLPPRPRPWRIGSRSIRNLRSTTDSGLESATPPDSGDVVDGPSSSGSSGASSIQVDTCQMCLARPIDGVFVHGNSCHKYGCYRCAKTTWRRSGNCPLCRRKITRVVKML